MKTRIDLISASVAVVVLSLSGAIYAFEPASAADKVFVGNVSQGGMYEVEASRLAETKAVAPDVRDTAYTEVHDHELVGKELKTISVRSGIPIAATLNAEFQQRLAKLKANGPSQFDAAYIADMEAIHDKDEKLFAKESGEGSANFKTFAHQTDLIVKRHIGSLHGLDVK